MARQSTLFSPVCLRSHRKIRAFSATFTEKGAFSLQSRLHGGEGGDSITAVTCKPL